MKRILFFVHYNKYNGLLEYVLHLLKNIKSIYNRIVFISNSFIPHKQKENLNGLCDTIIIRENNGFDFGAWKDGILQEGWDALSTYDNITLMNDTCFGPLFDLKQIYLQMEQTNVDFWGLTNYRFTKQGMPGTNRFVPEHIQSYFLCFSKKVSLSSVFQIFWDTIKYEKDIKKVIQKYETQLTSILARSGFTYKVYFDTRNYNLSHFNYCLHYPDLCIENKVPFVKIKSFICFSHPKYIIQLIRGLNYPVCLIHNYFTEIYNPNVNLQICEKMITTKNINSIAFSFAKVAIHLHVFFLDIFEKYIQIFDDYSFKFDLFITTDTLEKKEYIEKYLDNHITGRKLKEIVITENKGRDILPWLKIKNKLEVYDIVGHFHTKKSGSAYHWIGITWLQDIFNTLLIPINRILFSFFKNVNIGIIIPEIPYIFQYYYLFSFPKETKLHQIMAEMWGKMGCKKEIDFKDLLTAIMPFGTMFWYRPIALKSLIDFPLENFYTVPDEPFPLNNTVLHAIERLLVYIAWNDGYDYRIMTYDEPKYVSFESNIILNKYIAEYELIKKSKTYRIGNFFLFLPKLLKTFVRSCVHCR
jgi:rhamnosyltransferase